MNQRSQDLIAYQGTHFLLWEGKGLNLALSCQLHDFFDIFIYWKLPLFHSSFYIKDLLFESVQKWWILFSHLVCIHEDYALEFLVNKWHGAICRSQGNSTELFRSWGAVFVKVLIEEIIQTWIKKVEVWDNDFTALFHVVPDFTQHMEAIFFFRNISF